LQFTFGEIAVIALPFLAPFATKPNKPVYPSLHLVHGDADNQKRTHWPFRANLSYFIIHEKRNWLQ